MRLFAERGYQGTTVGAIEEAAGLTPRAGGLYRHFRSKREVLDAALERHVSEISTMGGVMDLLPLGDLRSELTLLVRWLLVELEREREVVRVIEREGSDVPAFRDRFRDEVVEVGFREAAEFTRRHLKETDLDYDPDVLAVTAVGTIVNFRRHEWTFGSPPMGLEEDHFATVLVDLLVKIIQGQREEQT